MFHTKTDAGREEIRARQLKLSRTARTLLLIVEPSKSTEEWMQMVRGATADDLQALLSLGLIAARPSLDEPPVLEVEIELPVVATAPAATSVAQPPVAQLPPPVQAPQPVAEAAASAPAEGLSSLTQRYTQLATRHLGLLESYRMVLEIERCASVAELRAMAPRLMSAVERNVGPEKAQRLRAELDADLSSGPR